MSGAARRRPLGVVTRGTTNPNRLRRVDNWIVATCADRLRAAADPLVVDLGYGATPVTAVELRARLAAGVRPDVRLVGLEIDPARVAAAAAGRRPAGPDLRPGWVRAGRAAAGAGPRVQRPATVRRERGRRRLADDDRPRSPRAGCWSRAPATSWAGSASWLLIDADGPRTLTLAAKLTTLGSPAELAERLPKALIHRNVPGEPVHDLIRALDDAWRAAAAYAPSAPANAGCARSRRSGGRLADPQHRLARSSTAPAPPGADGELTLPWPTGVTRPDREPRRGAVGQRAQLIRTGSGCRVTPKRACTPSRMVPGQGEQVGGAGGAAAVGEGEGVLAGDGDAPRAGVTLGEAGLVDQPGRADLDRVAGARARRAGRPGRRRVPGAARTSPGRAPGW